MGFEHGDQCFNIMPTKIWKYIERHIEDKNAWIKEIPVGTDQKNNVKNVK